jgi:hypothetical protein
MEKEKWICTAEGVEQFDCNRNSLGIGNKRALYYSKSIGKNRVYRSDYPTPPAVPVNDFVLFELDNKKAANIMCSKINTAHNDVFKPQFII